MHTPRIPIFLLVTVLGMVAPGRGEGPGRAGFSELRLGPVPCPVSLVLAADHRHVAYVMERDGRRQVFLNGRPYGPEFAETIVEDSIVFDRSGERLAYAVVRETDPGCTTCGPQGKWRAVIDGKVGPEYDKIHGLRFSADGKKTVYGAIEKSGEEDFWLLVVDGEKLPLPFEALSRESPAFTPDGRQLVYIAKKGEKAVVVVNEREEPAYDKIEHSIPDFSPDGRRMAYVAKNYDGAEGGMEAVVLDGKPGPKFDHIPPQSLLFSPDGGRLAYGGRHGGVVPQDPSSWVVIVDGQPGPEYDQVDHLAFSADGRHFAYKAKQGGRWRLVVDGRPRPECEELAEGFPVFSPDGRRLAFGFKEGGAWQVRVEVLDGAEAPDLAPGPSGIVGGAFTHAVGGITFSPDGRRLAFGAKDGDKRMVVVDGERGPGHDLLGAIVFSPDGKRVAYEAATYHDDTDDRWFVSVDGRSEADYEGQLMRGTLFFSANGRHLSYKVMKDETQRLVIDGQAGPRYKAIYPLLARGEDGFEAIAIREDLCRLVWTPVES